MSTIPDRAELERLAQFAEDLFLRCDDAQRAASPPSEWEGAIVLINQFTARLIRESVLEGRLVAAAESLVDPITRCCCGHRFLAQIECYITPDELAHLQALAEQPPIDFGAEMKNAGIDTCP
jgi:hypothetical protein